MVVDDERGIRDTISRMLELEGYAAVLAENGRDALTKLETCNPCLILLDVMMPVMGGLEFMKCVGEDPKLADIPIVLVTAYGSDVDASLARSIIDKPFRLHDILDTVKQYCDRERKKNGEP